MEKIYVILSGIAVGIAILALRHFMNQKIFPWMEKKSDAYPPALNFAMTNELILKIMGEIISVEPVFHSMNEKHSHNKPIDGKLYPGQICIFKLRIQGTLNSGFLIIELKEKGLSTSPIR